MNLEKFNNININLLEKELISDSYVQDLLLFIVNLDIENMIFEINNDQTFKIIKISQILLNFLFNKILEKNSNFIFQCNNCSKAFSKQEYLNNHIERRHVKKSLSENGIFPLAEQIKLYNDGLFVDSSSINDLKNEVKNLKNFFKETNEDLVKEKNARENLQKIIEFEIIDKLNFLQKTWSTDMIKSYDDNSKDPKDEKINEENSLSPESFTEKDNQKNLINQDTSEENLNVFLSKQTELLNKIGQSIEQFVKQNEKSEPNINLDNFRKVIFDLIHEEIENTLLNKEQKKKNVSKKFFQTKNNSKDLTKLSLHQFSLQNNNSINSTDEIVKEIDKIINDEANVKNLKTVTKNKKKIFPFNFLKSKSINHSEEAKSKNLNISNLVDNNSDSNKEEINNELINSKEFFNKIMNTSSLNQNNLAFNKNSSVLNQNDSTFNHDNLIFDQNNLQIDHTNSNFKDLKNLSQNEFLKTKNQFHELNLSENKNEVVKEEKTSKFKNFILKNKEKLNLNSNPKKTNTTEQEENTNKKNDKVLKSALKKTDNQNATKKLPKKLVFSDENIEFSAEENFSSETESLNSFNQIEQPVSIHKVVEKPKPAPRLTQQKSSYI